MKSIRGFNNSSLQGSVGDLQSGLSAINRIGAGVDIAKTAMSNDVNFQTSTGGTSYALPPQNQNLPTYAPFQCIVEKVKVGDIIEHRLKIVKGVCPAFVIQGFADESPDGSMTMIQDIYKTNIFPTDSKVTGTSTDSIFMEDGGYLKLEAEENYLLFLFLLQPGQVDIPLEFKAIQLVLSKAGYDQPDSIINTTQSKCFFSGGAGDDVEMTYTQSWCIRDNIAQLEWNSVSQRFLVYQYSNTPKLFYPVFNTTGTSAGDTYTAPMIEPFTGYTKNLETDGSLYTPAEQDQFPPLYS